MRFNMSMRSFLGFVIALSTAIGIGCSSNSNDANPSASADTGKIPITTKSEEARKEFLQGRALADKLRESDDA